MLPLVSVVIPAFNAEKYIKETIDSVLKQTCKDFEIIVVDDGSTDKTKKILEQYIDRINYIFQENSGPSKARNTGIKIAKGEYIAFLDADDLWPKSKLALQVDFMELHPDIDMVFADMMTFNQDGVILKSYLKNIKRENFYNILLQEQHELKDPFLMLLRANFIPTGTVMVRRGMLEKYNIKFDENISSVEDLDYWMRVSIFSKIGFIPEILKRKREHEENISKNLLKAKISAIYVRERIQKEFPKLAVKYKKGFDKRFAELYFSVGYGLFEQYELSEARQQFIRSLLHKATIKPFLYAVSCFLPLSIIRMIRRIKKHIGK